MTRITNKQLDAIADRLNKLTNSPASPYIDGKAQIGNYHISHANGGVCLHRMHNENGGVSSPLSSGHVTKRELASMLYAFIAGINFTVEA